MDEPAGLPDQIERVRCTSCQREIEEDEAQAQRWGYWHVGTGIELYPFCPECGERAFVDTPRS